ncbi:cytochrome c oxidase subunit II [Brevundimonas sp. BAL450]|jgi:cytochrome c oxidase subunit II|uniref:Cytochrome c oxidase subunit 2 n=1 Tax=Brevundimonas abyssalis TAR-001 TaxID=1391729 RepID=A0A8E0KLY8_9CAUL|nr:MULTISPECIES: cytochrome c oxidase subunit II [Brevundimonas]MBG7616308.1 cytochrome c oxidase subunit II [Brevundimonas sp. BAL450]GAD58862.1 cytochrome c oxidase polypeptide II [Brevundimonas abyssalis TAR-001]
MGMGKRARAMIASTVLASTALFAAAPGWAQELVGQPTPGGLGLQQSASPLKVEATMFHDAILMPIITAICLLVLGLLLWIVFRYNKRRNPVPAKWSHNTTIEIIWTVVPVLILMVIALFSFRLLFNYHDMPEPDVTVKVTGNQWNWTYEYPDHGVGEYVSNMMPEDEARGQGLPYLLAADEPMVVPVGQTVQLLVTASDVIHSVALPAFGLKTDAIPGRVNETWFRADRTGVFYGQCSELCGVDHAFMPLQINVVTQAEFEAWIAERGGAMPGAESAEDAATEASTAEAEVTETEDAPAADAAEAVQ